jgi:hypothetical protein
MSKQLVRIIMFGSSLIWYQTLALKQPADEPGQPGLVICHQPLTHHYPLASSHPSKCHTQPVNLQANQCVFNGYGAQEACNMIVLACFYPCMPTFMVCCDPSLFTSLHDALIKYPMDCMWLIKSKRLPLLSSERQFCFNSCAHKLYLQSVSCSHWYHVIGD